MRKVLENVDTNIVFILESNEGIKRVTRIEGNRQEVVDVKKQTVFDGIVQNLIDLGYTESRGMRSEHRGRRTKPIRDNRRYSRAIG